MDLRQQIEAYAYELLGKWGLNGVIVTWGDTQKLGMAHFREFPKGSGSFYPEELQLSKRWLPFFSSRQEAKDYYQEIVRHEIAHMVAGITAGHGRKWKAACRTIGAKPTRLVNLPKSVLDRYSRKHIQHILRCTQCGEVVVTREKRSKVVQHPELYVSRCCGKAIKPANS